MIRQVLLCRLLMLAAPLAAAELPAELWDRPRTAQAILAQPQLRAVMAGLQARPGARLELVHGSRAEARVQAEELRAWLVALALDPKRLQLRADATVAGLRLALVE